MPLIVDLPSIYSMSGRTSSPFFIVLGWRPPTISASEPSAPSSVRARTGAATAPQGEPAPRRCSPAFCKRPNSRARNPSMFWWNYCVAGTSTRFSIWHHRPQKYGRIPRQLLRLRRGVLITPPPRRRGPSGPFPWSWWPGMLGQPPRAEPWRLCNHDAGFPRSLAGRESGESPSLVILLWSPLLEAGVGVDARDGARLCPFGSHGDCAHRV